MFLIFEHLGRYYPPDVWYMYVYYSYTTAAHQLALSEIYESLRHLYFAAAACAYCKPCAWQSIRACMYYVDGSATLR